MRDIQLSDAPQLFERFTSRSSVMRYLPIRVQTDVAQAEQLIKFFHSLADKGAREFVIYAKEAPERMIGTIGLAITGHAAALAMKIAPDRFSMGSGCVIAPQFVHFLLAHDQIKRVWAYSDVDNKAVSNLLRQMGAHCEGTMRKYAIHPNISDEPRDCHSWSMVK